MINRSTIKYRLKKILPAFLFRSVLFVWQKLIIYIVEVIDKVRLKKFKGTKLAHLNHGGKNFLLYISPNNGFIDNYIFLYGVYESYMLDTIATYLKPGMTFIDIGANIGQHSMYAASIVGKTGSVHSYEPIPYISKQLTDSVQANHFGSIVHVHTSALGSKDSVETLYISKNVGGSSLVNDEDGTQEEIRVIVKNGDDELQDVSKIDMIKIDVEGYEYEVLSGLQETLTKHTPVILVEFSADFYTKNTDNHGDKILKLLHDLRYSVYDLENDNKEVTTKDDFLREFLDKRKQTNLLCIKK